MGFGTIFATIAMVVIIGTTTYLMVSAAFFSFDTLSQAVRTANELDNERLKTEIDIVNITVTVPDQNIINVTINNTGSTSILNSRFKHIDLFVYYHPVGGGGDQERLFIWLPYTETLPPENNTWTSVSIEPDIINPRIFDPDEQMLISIRVHPAINTTKTNWLKIVTPNAVYDSKHF